MSKNSNKKNTPLVLLLIDGLGVATEGEGNAVSKAKMAFWSEAVKKYPSAVLGTSSKKGKVDQSYSYSVIGGTNKNGKGLIKHLDDSGLNWCLLAEPDRIALSCLFFAGQQALPSKTFLVEDEEQDDVKLKNLSSLSDELIKRVKSGQWDVIFAFSSSLESIAREGDLPSTVQALEEIDRRLSKISKAVLEKGGCLILSAANGQAEAMIDVKTDQVNKRPSGNDVPLVIISQDFEGKTLCFPEAPGGDLSACRSVGTLADVAPTILSLLGMTSEKNLNGKNLIA
jgi:2,3-bisphosphoglycerate-independent phosphoglycerate mutase